MNKKKSSHRPKRLNTYLALPKQESEQPSIRANYSVAITPLHLKIRDKLVADGVCYLTADEFLAVVNMAWEKNQTITALSHIMDFNLWLNELQMVWYEIGYTMDKDGNLFFGYKTESKIHSNKSAYAQVPLPEGVGEVYRIDGELKINERDEKIFTLINNTAFMWICLYEQRHELELPRIAAGLPTSYD